MLSGDSLHFGTLDVVQLIVDDQPEVLFEQLLYRRRWRYSDAFRGVYDDPVYSLVFFLEHVDEVAHGVRYGLEDEATLLVAAGEGHGDLRQASDVLDGHIWNKNNSIIRQLQRDAIL